jgi:hypothetical protein
VQLLSGPECLDAFACSRIDGHETLAQRFEARNAFVPEYAAW